MSDSATTNPPGGIYSLTSLKRLAYLLDDKFKIPFTRYRLGWDFIIGLIPVAGDILTAIVSIHILVAARKYGVKGRVMWRMLANILIDVALGAIPLIGDVVDATWKSNAMNVKLLVKSIEEQPSMKMGNTVPEVDQ